jgi:hypothetical protein
MSDVTEVPQVKAAPKARKSTKLVPFSSCHVTFAKAKGIDVTRAGKLNRSYVRSNFEALAKVWPDLRKSQKINRDGNRYPAQIPANIAEMIVKRTVPARKTR